MYHIKSSDLDTLIHNLDNDDLGKRVKKAFEHLSSGELFVSLIPNHLFTKNENQKILQVSLDCNFTETNLKKYLKDWKKKGFYSKSSEEIIAEMSKIRKEYINAQVINESGKPSHGDDSLHLTSFVRKTLALPK